MEAGEGKPKAGLQISDLNRLLRHISILLDYVQRQGDSRLQACFGPIPPGNHPGIAPTPPNDTYSEFLTRLTAIERRVSATGTGHDLVDDDITFLRWSRDFLAALAAPATIETISMTEVYVSTRTDWAAAGWWRRLHGHPVEDQSDHVAVDEQFRKGAQWLARSIWRLELVTVLITILTIGLSAEAMVGRLIISQEATAFTKFQEVTRAADDAQLKLLKVSGADTYVKFEDGHRRCPVEFDLPTANLPTAANTRPLSAVFTGAPAIGAAALSELGAPVEVAWNFAVKCRSVQWALMGLLTENVRLKSWEGPFIDWFPMNMLIGWNDSTIGRVGEILSDRFCERVASSYNERFDHVVPNRGCTILFGFLVRDSRSVANSILACLTTYILPSLYAFIGAACATMLTLRRRTDESRLSYTDRGRVKYNVLLGIVFGGVIGIFAGFISSPNDGDKLGLSVLALLAGYNTPAVFDFLDDLSNRLFRPQRRTSG